MLSAKYIKNRNSISNDIKNINSSKNFKRLHLDIPNSNSSNSVEKNKILKLLNFDHMKKINISEMNNKITEPNKIIFSNLRLRNLQILSNDSSLNKLGKSTLDVNKMFGKINLPKNKEKEEIKKVHNEKFFSFKNEYILKFAKNAEYFNTFEKNSELISENRKDNFNENFKKIKRMLKNITNIFFNDYKVKINNDEDSKLEIFDRKSGFYKYKTNLKAKSNKSLDLPRIFATLPNEDISDLSIIEKNSVCESKMDENLNIKNKDIISGWHQFCTLMNKFISLIFTELRENKENIRKQNQKLKDYEVRLENSTKEIDKMQSFLSKYEVNSKIFLKIKNEKEIEKVKSIFNKKENEYILSNFRLKNEIKNLTSLLDENQKYYHKCKELENDINKGKQKNEELKYFYNQELQAKNMENIIHTEKEEQLELKIKELEKVIQGLQNDKDEYKKKYIENQIKVKNLSMNMNERNENILMQNEEIEWFVREYGKLNNNYLNIKRDLNNIENSLLNKMKKQEGNITKDEKNSNNKEEEDDNNESENSFLENMFQIK
jgi:hypothetical protein